MLSTAQCAGTDTQREHIMAGDWRERQGKDALATVDAFIAGNPEYTREDIEQPGQGATNWPVSQLRRNSRDRLSLGQSGRSGKMPQLDRGGSMLGENCVVRDDLP